MKTKPLPLWSWIFIVTILWIGFVLAISFMEAPIKFQAPSLTLPVALEIGYLVFHALNFVEITCAALIIAATYFGQPSRKTTLFAAGVVALLIIQTLLLFTKLDARTLAIINGQEVSSAPYHIVYMGIEVIKLLGLVVLAFNQLHDFKSLALKLSGQNLESPRHAR
ncbi:conserved hypothetical protein [Nitrosococcus halophilus Nc 4]|uniref:DUF4149 domain-containing protein n=1 Tax=Nitrosococcus halophilus (strain Nc4) TaxID=472759 RepID=D5BUV1_NITHN|nr:hypothetical protein [Nitrosococcus halophilus]ADE13501.1 conserved hypothetical protein [Nitrosococcus halophilus Nc 4]